MARGGSCARGGRAETENELTEGRTRGAWVGGEPGRAVCEVGGPEGSSLS